MFGIFRYILSLLVAFGHIDFMFQGRLNWAGLYAVFGFFLLSGYLMTRVLHQTYGYGARGVTRYLANRVLRIYPAYWAAVALTILCLVWAPDFAGHSKALLHLPESSWEYLRTFILVGIDRDFRPRLVPPSWSLHLELCFYFLMALGLSRTRWTTGLWITAAVGWTVWAVMHGVSFADRYSTLLGASLPFALGAGLHFIPWSVPRWILFLALTLFATNILAAPFLWGDPQAPAAFYLSLFLVLLIVSGLRNIRPSGRLQVLDRGLGNLSYPVFLIHSQIGCLLVWLGGGAGTFLLFLLALPVVHIVAAAIHFAVVVPIESSRARIRSRASPAFQSQQRPATGSRFPAANGTGA